MHGAQPADAIGDEPAGPAHAARPLRWRRTALVCGVAAVLAGLGLGAVALSDTSAPPRSAGPTAQQITVAHRPAPMPLSRADILALLGRPADLGALAEPQRWAACLRGLRRDPAQPILGATPVTVAGRPAVVVVFPGTRPTDVQAVTLDTGCDAAHGATLAETTLPRP
ncbi:hypothetical protein C1S82_18155 [Mycolicibacterium cosmeticum]|uniref:Hypothetical alanine rich protein n=1 Tax=Mycolicibacterium cosmeticum TaxID=258533 RepID=W9BKJ7_MYCCO|nr:hypothetical protein [Mycolicibacterium cosmeticum]TLH71707.1 hypothetical protein C1S82_18155 [Mycolicibacterium cosmeticum]CDO08020.1 hypothetical alanine rich protein [Mycolicibacterium cosmeticum]